MRRTRKEYLQPPNRLLRSFLVPGALLFAFILLPLLKLVLLSDRYVLWRTLCDPTTLRAVSLTAYAALAAVFIGVVFGIPLAYILARRSFPGKAVVQALIDLPIMVPHSAAGIALLFVFGGEFFFGKMFKKIGIGFVDSFAGIVVAMLFVSIPILVSAARESFVKVDPRLEMVARTLGASARQVFWRVTLPLSWRSIAAGALVMWARAMSEFGAVIILAYHPVTAPVLIYQRFEAYGLPQASAIAAIMILISGVAFLGAQMLLRRKNP